MRKDFEIREGYVQVPVAEFAAMMARLEDQDDVRAFDEALESAGEFFPLELTERILAGESPVRVFRDHRGLTQDRLAAASGVSQPMIAAIEAGRKTGTVATLKAIADALNVDLDTLAGK